MRILCIGNTSRGANSRHRCETLSRMGHDVLMADPEMDFSGHLNNRLLGALHYRSGYQLLQANVKKWVDDLLRTHSDSPPDLVWVNGGELLGRQAVVQLKRFGCPVLLYQNDDPTGVRDGHRFDSLLKAIPVYDLCVVRRKESVDEFRQLGAHSVHFVWMSYDEIMHRPFDDVEQIPETFRSDVAFIGTWIKGEQRDQFLLALIERGLNVAVWGGRWEKAPTWKHLQAFWRGGALSGRDYVAAMQGSKIALGFLSKGNRDLHTRRTMEIPYAGGLLCAERTSEHLELYREGEEAVFWSDVDECASHCHDLLANPVKRERIRQAGRQRVLANKVGNEDICREILAKVFP